MEKKIDFLLRAIVQQQLIFISQHSCGLRQYLFSFIVITILLSGLWPIFSHHPYYIHTYIIGHCNPSVRIMDLVSHTTYVVCVNFIHKWRDLLFKVDSERQTWETFHGNFIYSLKFLPEICWEEIAVEILFVFRFDLWPGTRTLAFSSNKPTHYLLDHGDFTHIVWVNSIHEERNL